MKGCLEAASYYEPPAVLTLFLGLMLPCCQRESTCTQAGITYLSTKKLGRRRVQQASLLTSEIYAFGCSHKVSLCAVLSIRRICH